ncbi:MAG: NUDIX hydrolase [Oscillochloris sp.]|nr:NUDIX hydrolase [Oscillochloris sp.]
MNHSRKPVTGLVVIGLFIQADQILLVQQQGRRDALPYWVAPGGLVEPGEGIAAALRREMREETGLHVTEIGPLAYTTQLDHLERDSRTLAFAFPISRWEGEPAHDDPDDEILAVRWIPRPEAMQLLQPIGWRGMRDPLLAYLRGNSLPGTFWHFQEHNGEQRLVGPKDDR